MAYWLSLIDVIIPVVLEVRNFLEYIPAEGEKIWLDSFLGIGDRFILVLYPYVFALLKVLQWQLLEFSLNH